jgi:uncharacterized membrane protein YecN with MAPEG domain
MTIHFAPLYAGLLGLIYVPLGFRIALMRKKLRVGIGDGGQPDLARAIRVHGNFMEYVPLALVLLFAVEMQGWTAWTVHALGIALVAARLLHIFGLGSSIGVTIGRTAGMTLTWLMILVASVMLIRGVLG